MTTQKHRGLYERPEYSFEFDERVFQWILDDEANPLNRISKIITNESSVILDVGAGNGVLARLLAFQGRHFIIDGVEPDSIAQQAASPHYRSLFCGTVDEFVLTCDGGNSRYYDFIVMADVLEHITHPIPTLLQLKKLLAPNGKLLISTPNIAFASVRLALMNGQFDYVDSGILERTHLRFYTLKSLQELFDAAGLHPQKQFYCIRDPSLTEIAVESFPFASIILYLLKKDKLANVYQFVFELSINKSEQCIYIDLSNRSTKRSSIIYWLHSIKQHLLGLRSIIK